MLLVMVCRCKCIAPTQLSPLRAGWCVSSEVVKWWKWWSDEMMKWWSDEIKPTLLTTHYSLLTTHCSLLTTRYSLLATRYSLLATRYSLLTAHCSLLTAHYSLLTAHYPDPDPDLIQIWSRSDLIQIWSWSDLIRISIQSDSNRQRSNQTTGLGRGDALSFATWSGADESGETWRETLWKTNGILIWQ